MPVPVQVPMPLPMPELMPASIFDIHINRKRYPVQYSTAEFKVLSTCHTRRAPALYLDQYWAALIGRRLASVKISPD